MTLPGQSDNSIVLQWKLVRGECVTQARDSITVNPNTLFTDQEGNFSFVLCISGDNALTFWEAKAALWK